MSLKTHGFPSLFRNRFGFYSTVYDSHNVVFVKDLWSLQKLQHNAGRFGKKGWFFQKIPGRTKVLPGSRCMTLLIFRVLVDQLTS